MSMTAHLHEDNESWCPSCGERIDVSFFGECDNDKGEYYVVCPDCGQSFYASKEY